MRKLARAVCASLFVLGASGVLAAPPDVAKVEPPNWWIGHSINPVRLLIRGANLHGARVRVSGVGVLAGNAVVNERGTYAFVDVKVAATARAGARAARVTTAEGSAEGAWRLDPPLVRAGRFAGFGSDDFIYLVMPDRFANGDLSNDDPARSPGLTDRTKSRRYHGGDLRGVIDRLPYLKDLGVTALWLNPWYDNVDRPNVRQAVDGEPIADYHGYGATDLYAVEEHFGDLATLRDLVDAAHRSGIKVIQDQVENHVGPDHPWVDDPPTPTWFNGTRERHLDNTWQTWTLADPHASAEVRRATLDGWFVNVLPDLNQDDPEVARALVQNTLWWMGATGIDGIRQDTLPYVPRTFWRTWTAAIKREHPRSRVVGEMWDGNPSLVSFFQGGAKRYDGVDSGIEALFDFPLFEAVRGVFLGAKPPRELAKVLAQDRLYVDSSALVTFLGNHDTTRFMSEPGATIDGLKRAFTFLMTTRGIPMVYYGDEIGLLGGPDPDNRRDFPGGWPGDPRNAFTEAGRTSEENDVFRHVRTLAALRAELQPLRRGALVHLRADDTVYAYARKEATGAIVVAFNLGAAAADLDLDVATFGIAPTLVDRMGCAPPAAVASGRLHASLPAGCAAIYASHR